MGFLDTLLGNPDQTQALGLLGAGFMSRNPAQGFLLANEHLAGASKRRMQEQYQQMQMQELQQKMEEARAQREWRANMPDPTFMAGQQALAGGGGPTMENAGRIPPVSPMQQLLHGGAKVGAIPMDAYLKTFEPREPKYMTVGNTLVQTGAGGVKPVYTDPKEKTLPAAIQEYQFAQGQGYKGTFEQWDRDRKKAGATSVNLAVNTEKNLLGGVADAVSGGIKDARGSAQAALGTIGTVNRLMDALDSGQVMAGPGTTFRQYGLQVGSMLGVGGQTAQEKLLNTRQAIQSLAQLELDAAQQMKGQGQITEAERAIIKRAASGDIDGMTVPELRLLGGILDRTARSKIRNYSGQVAPLRGNPNAAPLVPFLDVQEPPARQAPNVLRFDAQGNPIR